MADTYLGESVFMLGTSITAIVKSYRYMDGFGQPHFYEVCEEIIGAGPMYKSASEFKANIGNFRKEWLANNFKQKVLIIPEQVTTIADYAFDNIGKNNTDAEGKNAVEKIVLPDSIEKIGDYAFRYNGEWQGVSAIEVGENVVEIGMCAFMGQNQITHLDFKNNPTIIGGGAFAYCKNLAFVNISDDWIGRYTDIYTYNTFDGCNALHTISPNNVLRDIRWFMYRNCNNLSKMTILEDRFPRPEEESILSTLTVAIGAGSVLDDDGYFITEVNKDSIISPEVAKYDWKTHWHRILVYTSFMAVYLYHMGKCIKIKCYKEGDIALAHDDIMFFLKWVELNGTESHSEQTPLHVAHNGKWYQICY